MALLCWSVFFSDIFPPFLYTQQIFRVRVRVRVRSLVELSSSPSCLSVFFGFLCPRFILRFCSLSTREVPSDDRICSCRIRRLWLRAFIPTFRRHHQYSLLQPQRPSARCFLGFGKRPALFSFVVSEIKGCYGNEVLDGMKCRVKEASSQAYVHFDDNEALNVTFPPPGIGTSFSLVRTVAIFYEI